MLGCHADAPVQLQRFLGHLRVGGAREVLGRLGLQFGLGIRDGIAEPAEAVEQQGLGCRDQRLQIGAAMLQRLEQRQRTTKLAPHLQVFHRQLQQGIGAAHGVGREPEIAQRAQPAHQRLRRRTAREHERLIELQAREAQVEQAMRPVPGRTRDDLHARTVQRRQRDAVAGARPHQRVAGAIRGLHTRGQPGEPRGAAARRR